MLVTTTRAAITACAALAITPAGVALAQDVPAAPPSVVQLCAATDIGAVDSLLAGAAGTDLVGALAPLVSLTVPADPDGVAVGAGVELDDVRTALGCAADPDPTTEPTPTVEPTPTEEPPLYEDCAAAVAAGAAPIVAANGEAGYRLELDRDGDGIACEANEGPAPTTTTSAPSSTIAPAPSSSGGFSQLDDVPTRAAETGGGPA